MRKQLLWSFLGREENWDYVVTGFPAVLGWPGGDFVIAAISGREVMLHIEGREKEEGPL